MKEKKNTLDHNIDALIKSHFEEELGTIEDKPLPPELRKAKPEVGTRPEPKPAPENVLTAGTRRGAAALIGTGRAQGGAYSGYSEHRIRDILFKAAGIALIIILPSLAVIKRHQETPLSGSIAEAWKSEDLGTKVMSGLSRLQNIYHNTQK